MNSYVRAWKKPLGENSKRLNMYYIYIALDCLNWERPPFRLARKLAWFWSRLARYLIFLAKYPFFQLRISWLIGANGSGFIFLEPSIRLADSQFANRVLGQSSNLSGYKKSPKSLIYKGFGRCALASLARFERAAFRLGVWRFFWYDIPIITSHYFWFAMTLCGYWSICTKIRQMPPRYGLFRMSN